MALRIGSDNSNDLLIGTAAADIFRPGTSLDTVTGDVVSGDGGRDRLQIDYSSDTSGVGITSTGAEDGSILSGDFLVSYTSIERFEIVGTSFSDQLGGGATKDTLDGGAGDDVIDGNAGVDVLIGGLGNDILRGGNGNDTITGGAGKDALNGGQGADEMSGGAGVDFYIVDNARDIVIENANEGSDTVISATNYTLTAHVENLTLNETSNATQGSGNDLNNRIKGNSRNNLLSGGLGLDNLKGFDGNDSLFGGADKDFLFGGNGNDLLQGDAGRDYLVGDAGSDRFRFNAANEGPDRIADFEAGTDIIQISRSGFGLALSNGFVSADNFVLGSRALDADDFFIYDDARGQLFFDANGNGTGGRSVVASLGSGAGLGRTDIQLIS